MPWPPDQSCAVSPEMGGRWMRSRCTRRSASICASSATSAIFWSCRFAQPRSTRCVRSAVCVAGPTTPASCPSPLRAGNMPSSRAARAPQICGCTSTAGPRARSRAPRNERVPLQGGHRIAENLRLARAVGLSAGDGDLQYWVPDRWRSARVPGTLGLHPGSMAWKGNEVKRWPYERFAELARSQAAAGRAVRFFLGPHEET